MINGTGAHMKKIRAENEERVRKYMEAHPESLMKDACKHLGISGVTLAKHLKAIKANPRKENKGG